MVIRPETESAPRRASTTWSALKTERLILQAPPAPVRHLIDQHLGQAGIDPRTAASLNRLDTVIAMVEAGEGTGIVPSFTLPVCRRRNVIVSRLINPEVPVDFFQIRNRGRKLSTAGEEFTTFLQSYIAQWAGRAGVL
jgi:LysR family transcriptional regulator, carnitine catabolism transcriptional activator